jgi:hypothetical protein
VRAFCLLKRRQQQRPGRNQYRIVHSRSERLESTASTLFDSPDRHADFVFTNTNSCRVSRISQSQQPAAAKERRCCQRTRNINRSLLYRTRTTNSSTTTSLCFFLHSVPPALWVQRPTNGTPVSRLCPTGKRASGLTESRVTLHTTTNHEAQDTRSGRKNRKPEKRKAPVGYLR